MTTGARLSWLNQTNHTAIRKYLKCSHAELAAMLLDGLPDTATCVIDLSDRGSGTLDIKVPDADGSRLMFMKARLKFGRAMMEEGDAWVKPEARGKGLGRKAMGNLVSFALAHDMRRFDGSCERNNGAYTWARAGWLPYEGEWQALGKRISERMKDLEPWLDDLSLSVQRHALKSGDPRAVRILADDRRDISGILRERKIESRDSPFRRFFTAAGIDETQIFGPIGHVPEHFTAGQLWLVRETWEGTLDLTDEESLTRFRAWAGMKDETGRVPELITPALYNLEP